MSHKVLTEDERRGLTIWGTAISAQIRDQGQMALYIREDAPRSSEDENPVILPASDVAKLCAMLNEASLHNQLRARG